MATNSYKVTIPLGAAGRRTLFEELAGNPAYRELMEDVKTKQDLAMIELRQGDVTNIVSMKGSQKTVELMQWVLDLLPKKIVEERKG